VQVDRIGGYAALQRLFDNGPARLPVALEEGFEITSKGIFFNHWFSFTYFV
jgi:hypothetical protein